MTDGTPAPLVTGIAVETRGACAVDALYAAVGRAVAGNAAASATRMPENASDSVTTDGRAAAVCDGDAMKSPVGIAPDIAGYGDSAGSPAGIAVAAAV